MSIKLMTTVWQLELEPTDKLVLLALADNASDEGHCYPSVSTLVRKSNLNERTVQRVLSRLEEGGHITKRLRTGRSTVYDVHPNENQPPAQRHPRHSATPGTAPPAPGVRPPPPPAQDRDTPGVRPPITIIEPSIEPSLERTHARANRLNGIDDSTRQYAQAAGMLSKALREKGVIVTCANPVLIDWLRDGFTSEQLIDAVEAARMNPGCPDPLPAKWLDKVVRDAGRRVSRSNPDPVSLVTWRPEEESEHASA
jgi:hypothetical protein